MTRRCTAFTEDGSPCKAWATKDSEPARCHFHTKTKEQQLELSRKGGLGKRKKELPVSWVTISWVLDLLVKVINGTLSSEKAHAILAPVIAPDNEHALRELLESIHVREEADLIDPYDRLEEAREAIRQLYAEGKIGLDQIPSGVLAAEDVPITSSARS